MKFFRDKMRHLVCVPYSVENLHQMADALGIKRCWFHNGSYPHYDIPKGRIVDLSQSVPEISPREILKICKGERA